MLQLLVGQTLNGVIVGTLYGIIALGVTLTFGITGIVNFALGEFMMIGAYVTWYMFDIAGLPYPLAILPAVAIAAGCGFAADQLLFRFTRNNLINGLLVSIGLISIIEAAALVLWTTTPKDMGYVLSGAFRLGAVSLPKMKIVVFALLAAVMFLTYAALSRTWMGRAAYAFSQNPEAAMLMGVRTEILQSGVVVYSTYSLEPAMGGLYILKGVEAAILGGIGSLIGSVAGGIILGVTEAVGSIYLPGAFRDAYGLVFVVAILLYQPAGLFGTER